MLEFTLKNLVHPALAFIFALLLAKHDADFQQMRLKVQD
jgi:hypothetical protein